MAQGKVVEIIGKNLMPKKFCCQKKMAQGKVVEIIKKIPCANPILALCRHTGKKVKMAQGKLMCFSQKILLVSVSLARRNIAF